MIVPQGLSIEEEKQGAAHSIANHTTLLEGTKWVLAVLEEHGQTLSDLPHQQKEIEEHFALSECQVN